MGKSGRTVLIVDSDPAIRYYHAMLLMRLHYAAMTDWPPDEALMRMERSVPSLILTTFPALTRNGTDFIKTLNTSDRTREIPIIALVDENNAEHRASSGTAGCAASLVKPADPQQLFQTIQSFIETIPRAHIRLNLSLKVVVGAGSAPGGIEQEAYTSMISEGGFSMRTYAPMPKHTVLLVTLFIPGREITTRAEVLYHIPVDPIRSREPGMGLKFIDLLEDDRTFLRTFIREQLVHDIKPRYRTDA